MAIYDDSTTPQKWCSTIADFLQANPTAWCQRSLARTTYGLDCDSDDPAATGWCTVGLLEKFVGKSDMVVRCMKLLSRAITPYGAPSHMAAHPIGFNDYPGRTVDDVIALFRCASYMPEIADHKPQVRAKSDWSEETVYCGFGQALGALSEAAQATLAAFDSLPAAKEPTKIVVPDWTNLSGLSPAKGAGSNNINPQKKLDESQLAGADVVKLSNWVTAQWSINQALKYLKLAA